MGSASAQDEFDGDFDGERSLRRSKKAKTPTNTRIMDKCANFNNNYDACTGRNKGETGARYASYVE